MSTWPDNYSEQRSAPVSIRMRSGNIQEVEYIATTFINTLKQIFKNYILHGLFDHTYYTYITKIVF